MIGRGIQSFEERHDSPPGYHGIQTLDVWIHGWTPRGIVGSQWRRIAEILECTTFVLNKRVLGGCIDGVINAHNVV